MIRIIFFLFIHQFSLQTFACEKAISVRCSNKIWVEFSNGTSNQEITKHCSTISSFVYEALTTGPLINPTPSFIFRPTLSGYFQGQYIVASTKSALLNPQQIRGTLLHEIGHYLFHQKLLSNDSISSEGQEISLMIEDYSQQRLDQLVNNFTDKNKFCGTMSEPGPKAFGISITKKKKRHHKKYLNKYHELFADFYQCVLQKNSNCQKAEGRSFAPGHAITKSDSPYNYFSITRNKIWNHCHVQINHPPTEFEKLADALESTMKWESENSSISTKDIQEKLLQEVEYSCNHQPAV